MRVLCLHGHGTSASIFKSQTVAFRNKLDNSFTFDFVDAPFHCAPAPGIRVLFDTGHYTWWPKPTINSIRAAHHWLTDYISQHGPYDAVCGFSQGCSLIGSFLLYHAHESALAAANGEDPEPLPFRAAVFICSGLPLPVLDDLGIPVSQRARDVNDETVRLLTARAGALTDYAANLHKIKPGVGLWDETTELLHDPAVMPGREDVFGLDFTAMREDAMITAIPTVHVYGAKDPRWPASVQLAHFCERRRMYDHGGGHDIPRSTEVSVRMAELFRELEREIGEER